MFSSLDPQKNLHINQECTVLKYKNKIFQKKNAD